MIQQELFIDDPVIASQIEKRDAAETRRQFNRLVKARGGSWKCRGWCGRTISANRPLCLSCAKSEVTPSAVDLVG